MTEYRRVEVVSVLDALYEAAYQMKRKGAKKTGKWHRRMSQLRKRLPGHRRLSISDVRFTASCLDDRPNVVLTPYVTGFSLYCRHREDEALWIARLTARAPPMPGDEIPFG